MSAYAVGHKASYPTSEIKLAFAEEFWIASGKPLQVENLVSGRLKAEVHIRTTRPSDKPSPQAQAPYFRQPSNYSLWKKMESFSR